MSEHTLNNRRRVCLGKQLGCCCRVPLDGLRGAHKTCMHLCRRRTEIPDLSSAQWQGLRPRTMLPSIGTVKWQGRAVNGLQGWKVERQARSSSLSAACRNEISCSSSLSCSHQSHTNCLVCVSVWPVAVCLASFWFFFSCWRSRSSFCLIPSFLCCLHWRGIEVEAYMTDGEARFGG